ncbi:MAG: HD domain-containing protein [Bacillota bacterium]|nr:HD domain-containing protein [Bacillota bacterium]
MGELFVRLNQVWDALFGKLSKEDMAWVKSSLTCEEYSLFLRLSRPDQYHSFKVAKTAISLCLKDETEQLELSIVKKAALLHDIGKADQRLLLLERILPVVTSIISLSLAKYIIEKSNINGIARGFYVYAYHGSRGQQLALIHSIDHQIIEVIAKHQQEVNKHDSKLLRLIKIADSRH